MIAKPNGTIKNILLNLFLALSLFIPCSSKATALVDVRKDLANAMNFFCKTQPFTGSVLVAMDDKIIYENVCGFANRSFNVPNSLDTKFNLGSVGKLFTSLAIVQLIKNGKIALSTPIFKIVPDWLPKDERSKFITIGQLLTHTSGLGNFMDDSRWKLGSDSGLYVTVNDYKPILQADHLLFSPGTSQSYSNNGYMLLGAVIEAISHESYLEYLQKNIFNPSGMTNTGIWPLDEIITNRAEGYFEVCKNKQCHWKNNNFEAPFMGSPAGGAYSTIEDLFKFSRYLHSKWKTSFSIDTGLVPKNIKIKLYKIDDIEIPEYFSPYGFAGEWNQYGLAIWKNPLLIGHTGGIQGASAFFATSPDGKYTIVILSNISGSGPIKLYKQIRQILGFSDEIINY